MVARIHHTKNGTEYVLQYNIRSDTIELRIIKHTLLGRFPNYFRHKSGRPFHEIATFKEILRSLRTRSGVDQFPELTEDEEALIHAFEEIADTRLLLTPESMNRFYQTVMQGAANGFNPAAESLRELASNLQGLDMNPLLAYMNGRVSRQLAAFAASADMLAFPIRREMAEYFLPTGDLEQRLSDPARPTTTYQRTSYRSRNARREHRRDDGRRNTRK